MEEKVDAELVRLARADQKDAFQQLVERYQVMAYCLALRLCRQEETARELVQEAILQAYLSLDHLQEEARFKNWFYGIVLNVYRNWMRTSGQKQPFSLDARSTSKNDDLFFSGSSSELLVDPQEIVEDRELRQLVRDSLQLLSRKNRLVAQLFYYEDMSIQQIASQLQISQGAVKNRLFKGREHLRSHLQSLYPELAYRTTEKTRGEPMITATIARIEQDLYRTVVILWDERNQRALPLWFPAYKNTNPALLMSMSQEDAASMPTTLELMTGIFTTLGGGLKNVVIDALQGSLLYAQLHLHSTHGQRTLKAHLHDALPLALRMQSTFVVSEEVFRLRGIEIKEPGVPLEQQLDTITEIAKNDSTPMKTNGDLEFVNDLTGWELHMDREHTDYYLDKQITYTGKPSLVIVVHESQERIQLKHEDILADPYSGQRIRLVAYLKTESVEQASLHLGVSAPSLEPGGTFPAYYFADNQQPIEGTQDWQRHELVIDVPEDAYSLAPFFNMRNGKVWLNGIHVTVVDKSVPLTGTDLMLQPYPLNLDFSQGRSFWQLEGSGAREDSICGIEQREQGEHYAFLAATVEQPQGTILLQQTLHGKRYPGKVVRFSASIATRDVVQQASLFISTGDRTEDRNEQMITGTTTWTDYAVERAIPGQWGQIFSFGITLHGQGRIQIKDVQLVTLEEESTQ
jgi:RNA polymerase sigma-70 factor (ECF subfamily)